MKNSAILMVVITMASLADAEMILKIIDNGDGTVGILNSAYTGINDDMFFCLVSDTAPYPFGGYVTDCAPAGTEIGTPGILQMIWPPPGPDGVWGFIGDVMGVSTPACVSINGINAPIGATVKLYKINDDWSSVTLLDSCIISSKPEDMDYGDCPEPYPTLLAENGARHGIGDPNLFLGNTVDLEPDGQPTPDANGDDANGLPDEDGVFFLTDIRQGETADVNVIASKQGLLDAWLDFNADGDFNDPGEHIFTSFPLNSGSNIITFNVPANLLGSGPTLKTYARFRFSSTGGLDPTGPAEDGEVEDYMVQVWIDCLIGGNAGPKEYSDWVAWGKPACWCYQRQCRGDINGKKTGPNWVQMLDLNILASAYGKTDAQLAAIPNGICADLNHKKTGPNRVQMLDLQEFTKYYGKLDAQVPSCDAAPLTTGPYNFWTSP